MPKIKNALRTYPRLRKGGEFLLCIVHKIMGTFFSRLNVHQLHIAFCAVHVQGCFIKYFLFIILFSFFLAVQGCGYFNKGYS